MKKRIKLLIQISFIIGFISFNSIIYILYKLNYNLLEVIDKNTIDYIGLVGYLFIIFFHLISILFIIVHFRHFKFLNLLRIISLITGIISLFAIGAEKILFDEIAREYAIGWEVAGEIIILEILLFMNITFCLLMFTLIFKTLTYPQKNNVNGRVKDETIFTLAQYMGIISGIMGILHTIKLTSMQVNTNKFWIYLPFYFLFILPYIITVTYWLIMKMKEKIVDWYDEKQLKDVLKSSLTTLTLSIPGMTFFLLIAQHSTFYWFPYYLFLILLIFSSSTLYYYKLE